MENIFLPDNEFNEILERIILTNKSEEEWDLIESCDYFQTPHYVGGWDATEQAFCFSFYDGEKQEHWFQLSMEQIVQIKEGKLKEISLRKAS